MKNQTSQAIVQRFYDEDILEQINPQDGMDSAAEIELIRSTERKRLKAMVEADMAVAVQMHADDFQLINPRGGALSKEEYLGLVAAGDVNYLVWEPITEIAVRRYGVDAAIIRYQSKMENVVFGEKSAIGYCWHTDSYEKRDGQWQVVWAQATTIQP